MPTCISKYDDVIDSHDVIARIDELHEVLDEGLESYTADEIRQASNELASLAALQEAAEDYSNEWNYGSFLIRDSYFPEYAENLCADLGMTDDDVHHRWPFTHIDWDAAADELKNDYFSVDYDGVTYWVQ